MAAQQRAFDNLTSLPLSLGHSLTNIIIIIITECRLPSESAPTPCCQRRHWAHPNPWLAPGPERVSGSFCPPPFLPDCNNTATISLCSPVSTWRCGKDSLASAHQPPTLLVSVRRHVERAPLSPNPISYIQNTQRHNNPPTAHMSTLSPGSRLMLTYRG